MTTREQDVERSVAEAERLFRTAVRRYRRAAPVIFNARVARAARSLKKAGGDAQKAMDILARAVGRRFGWEDGADAGDVAHVLHGLGTLDREVNQHCPGMLKHVLDKLPPRRAFDDWLIRDGRTVLDEFTRIGRLDLDSREAGRLAALVRLEFGRLLPAWPVGIGTAWARPHMPRKRRSR